MISVVILRVMPAEVVKLLLLFFSESSQLGAGIALLRRSGLMNLFRVRFHELTIVAFFFDEANTCERVQLGEVRFVRAISFVMAIVLGRLIFFSWLLWLFNNLFLIFFLDNVTSRIRSLWIGWWNIWNGPVFPIDQVARSVVGIFAIDSAVDEMNITTDRSNWKLSLWDLKLLLLLSNVDGLCRGEQECTTENGRFHLETCGSDAVIDLIV